MQKRKAKHPGGRPRKFRESSHPVTVTLPERTLSLLESIDADRAHAMVKAVDWATRSDMKSAPPVEIVKVDRSRAVIVVGPSRCLRTISWLRLIEIAPSRFLLVIPTGTPLETLEVAVMDLADSLAPEEEYERNLLGELRRRLTMNRRREKVSKAELLLLDIE